MLQKIIVKFILAWSGSFFQMLTILSLGNLQHTWHLFHGLWTHLSDSVWQGNQSGTLHSVHGTFCTSCTYNIASAFIYISKEHFFYIGALLPMAPNSQSPQPCSLHSHYWVSAHGSSLPVHVFCSKTFSWSSLIIFPTTQKIAKAAKAAHDFNQLLHLSMNDD